MDAETFGKRLKLMGWVISLSGTGLYLFGYFYEEGMSIVNWPGFLADYLPNWQAEAGFVISMLGCIPLFMGEAALANAEAEENEEATNEI